MAILILIIGILLFVCLIVIHEFGHLIAARRNGVEVEEFSIFFGPAIYKRKTKGGWLFKICTVPLGGYVKLKGEHDDDTEPGSYGAASLWVKTKIMVAGVFSNLVVGFILLIILALIGLPQIIPNQFTIKSNEHVINTVVEVGSILSGTPAATSTLKTGDDITAIGPRGDLKSITSFNSLQSVTKEFAGQKVLIDYTRHNVTHQTAATLNSVAQANTAKQKVYLGVSVSSIGVPLLRYSWAAPLVALGLTKQIIVVSGQGLGHALKGLGGIVAGTATHNPAARKHAQKLASGQVVGPLGIYFILKDGSAIGFQFMLFIIALLSLALAIMNILPIPALDGGRLWLTLISRGIKHPMPAQTEEIINAIGMLTLLVLFVFITYVDYKRFL